MQIDKKIALKILVAVVVIALMVAGGVRIIKKKRAEIASAPLPKQALLPVQTVSVKRDTFEATQRYLATIRPKVSAEISPRLSADILDVLVREGTPVKRGELLVLLDDREQKDRVSELSAQLSAARSQYETLEAIYKRDLELFNASAISREALDRSRSSRDSALAQVKTLEKQLATASTVLSYTRLVAPFDGTVTARFMDPGSLAMPGKPVLVVEAPGKGYFLEIKLPQASMAGMNIGHRIDVLPPGRSGKYTPFATEISRIVPSTGAGSLGVIEADVSASPFGLPTGSTLYVNVHLSEYTGLVVPLRALLENCNGTFLFAVDDDGLVSVKEVSLLYRGAEEAVVESTAISQGQRVIVAQESALLRLHDGQKVFVTDKERLSGTKSPSTGKEGA